MQTEAVMTLRAGFFAAALVGLSTTAQAQGFEFRGVVPFSTTPYAPGVVANTALFETLSMYHITRCEDLMSHRQGEMALYHMSRIHADTAETQNKVLRALSLARNTCEIVS